MSWYVKVSRSYIFKERNLFINELFESLVISHFSSFIICITMFLGREVEYLLYPVTVGMNTPQYFKLRSLISRVCLWNSPLRWHVWWSPPVCSTRLQCAGKKSFCKFGLRRLHLWCCSIRNYFERGSQLYSLVQSPGVVQVLSCTLP